MKKYNLIILLFVLFLIQANAQVGVISEIEERGPETNVFLEANNYDNYYGENDRGKGLLFPRVDLTTFKFTEAEENGSIPYVSVYDGMVVYNSGKGKTGTGAYQSSTEVDVIPGFYYFSNPKGLEEFQENYNPIAAIALGVWTPLGNCCCDDGGGTSPSAPAAPAFVKNGWATVDNASGQPAGLAKMEVTVSDGSTIQWYDKNGAPIGAVTGQSEWDPQLTLNLLQPGVHTYYAEAIKDGKVSATRTPVTFTVCGAETNDGGWLRFMCHNVGTENTGTLDPFTWNSTSDLVSNDVKGGAFQWGRIDDLRNATATVGRTSNPVPTDGIFYYNSSDWCTIVDNNRWSDAVKKSSDPCPTGWRVPTKDQWVSIYSNTTTNGGVADATANVWEWTGHGYKVGDALYLPAAGGRWFINGAVPVGAGGTTGYYWSSTAVKRGSDDMTAVMNFTGGDVIMSAAPGDRANGFTVRCVAE